MKTAEPNARLREAVRGFYAWLGSVAFAAAAPFLSSALIETNATAGRVGGVALAVLGWVPMMLVVAKIIASGDEFNRRIHTAAIAIAFAGALLVLTALDWLVRARFIDPPELSLVWLAIATLWFRALMATKRHFERLR